MKQLPDWLEYKPLDGFPMDTMFPGAQDDLIRLLEALLEVNPLKRANCTEALKMPYFL